MTTSRRRVAVIGVGTMGAQALWRCAAQGADVVGFEQFAPGHDKGAAGGESRIFRNVHFEDPRYVPLMRLADRCWDELADETGCALRSAVGCAILGPPEHPQMRAALDSVHQHDLPHRLLTAEEARTAFPQFRLDPDDQLLLDPHAGFVRPELAVRTAARRAVELGARLDAHHRIATIARRGNVVDVHLEGGDVMTFDAVVVALGPWIKKLLPEFQAHVDIRRPVSAWYLPTRPERYTPNGPAFIRTGPQHFYGVPSPDGVSVKLGLSAAHHQQVPDPDDLDKVVPEPDLTPFTQVIAGYLPGLNPDPIRVQTYLEAYTRDGHPIVGLAPGADNVVVLGSFSGHGFKLAPAIGEIAADLAIDGGTRHPIEVFDPQRF